jgi:chromosome segregation ATPase
MKSQLEHLQEQLKTQGATGDEKNTEIQDLKIAKQNLTDNANNLAENLKGQLAEANSQSSTDLARFEKEKSDADALALKLRAEVDAAGAKNTELTAQSAKITAKISELEKRLEVQTQEATQATDEVNIAEFNLHSSEKTNMTLTEDLAAKTQTITKLNLKLDASLQESLTVNNKVSELTKTNHQSARKISDLESSITNLESANTSLTESLNTQRLQYSELETEYATFQSTNESTARRLLDAETEFKLLKNRSDQSSLTKKSDQEAWETKNELLEKKYSEKEKEIQILHESKRIMRLQLTDGENEIKNLGKEKSLLENRVRILEDRHLGVENELGATKIIVNEKLSQIDFISREAETSTIAKDEVSRRLDGKIKELDVVKERLAGIEKELQGTKEKLRVKDAQVTGLELEVESLGQDLITVQGERKELKGQVDELERAAAASKRKIEGFGKERASLGTKADEFNQEYAKVNAKLLESESSNLTLEHSIRTLEKDLRNEQSRSSEAAEKI